jgi:hypothetical protein
MWVQLLESPSQHQGEIALLLSQIQQRIVGLFLQMEPTSKYLLLAVVAEAAQTAVTAAVVVNFDTQVLHHHGLLQLVQPSLFKLVPVAGPQQMEVHQLLIGVVLTAIELTVEKLEEVGKVQLFLQVAQVVPVAQVQTAKVQPQHLRATAVLQQLVQLNKQVDPTGGVQDGL